VFRGGPNGTLTNGRYLGLPMRSRHWWALWLAVALAAAVAGSSGAGGAGASTSRVAEPPPVASLEPQKTAALWRRLVSAPRPRQARLQQADCRPLRAVFYAATDFLRLATKLAESASPCAEYYISVPAIVGNRTQMRPNAAPRIRALGPNFHAMAEVHFTTWNRWVAETGSSWHAAGVTARQRMASAGYDVSLGDTWALNELSTAVRRGTGNARANIREFLRGLYEGDGSRPTRGAALVVGLGQRSSDISLYQTNIQNWLTDSAFWTDMSTYVSDWVQEVYGDVRSYAAPGVPQATRRDYLNDYLQHKLVLASAGPTSIEPARAYLRTAYAPLANAAWERDCCYGWTMVAPEQMAAYVSGQTHALRHFSATTGQPQDHWGFAWAPRNGRGIPAGDFAAQTGLVLDRLAAAIRDSGQTVDAADPGSAACGPPGQNVHCVADLEGARPVEAWKSFRGWTQSVLSLGATQQTVAAGAASAPIPLSLATSSGLPVTTTTPLAITLRSSSVSGGFSTTPAGPWTPTLSLTIAAGTGTGGSFYYRDERAGKHTLTATSAGTTSGTVTMTVTPGAVASIAIGPASDTIVRARESRRFEIVGLDAFGNQLAVSPAWSVSPRSLGKLRSAPGGAVTLTAGRTLGSGMLVASMPGGTIRSTVRVTVRPGQLRIGSITYRGRGSSIFVTARAVDVAGRPISAAVVSVRVRRDGRNYLTARGTTGAAGKTVFRVPVRQGRCFTTAVRRVKAQGFTWNGRTPRNRLCRARG
jgi:hypothetical protein